MSHILVRHDEACFVVAEGNNFSASPLVRLGESYRKRVKIQCPTFWSATAKLASSLRRETIFQLVLWFIAAKLRPNFLVRSSEATFAAEKSPLPLRSMASLQRRDPSPRRSDSYSAIYKYLWLVNFFPSTHFCATLCLLLLSGVRFLQIPSQPQLLLLPRRSCQSNDINSAQHHERHLPPRTILADSSPRRKSGSTTSRFASIHSFKRGVFLPPMHSSTSPSRPEDSRHCVLPQPLEWP